MTLPTMQEMIEARRASTSAFRAELVQIINRYSRENGSNTSDFILASYLMASLDAFDMAVSAREEWYGRGAKPVEVEEST